MFFTKEHFFWFFFEKNTTLVVVSNLKPGEMVKLNSPTFILGGVLILQSSNVEVIQTIDDKTTEILYLDKEANPHNIKVKTSDLG